MAPLEGLRAHAFTHTLFGPRRLSEALGRLVFVQADPIRAPARAQDLILRHRVKDYRVDDLERAYPRLALEEDYLYAHGFLSRPLERLIHPRPRKRLSRLERDVLEAVCGGARHPRDLAPLGRGRVVNAWGGHSKDTKQALERLHHQGLIRVAGRERGIRLYGPREAPDDSRSPSERLRGLVMGVAEVLAPIRKRTLLAIASRLRRSIPKAPRPAAVVDRVLASGALERQSVEGVVYLWPAGEPPRRSEGRPVRILAPFDPLVWDRGRFEHLWQWAYRFEAYTPPTKRERGYYAMPLAWGTDVVGWANLAVVAGRLDVALGFVRERPRDPVFDRELDAEVTRFEVFLSPRG